MAANLLERRIRFCQVVGLHLWIDVALMMLLMTLVLLKIDSDFDSGFDSDSGFVPSYSLQYFHLTLRDFVYLYLSLNLQMEELCCICYLLLYVQLVQS